MIDTFSCIHFDLPHLIFKEELAIKYTFSYKEFLLKFNEINATSDCRSVPFFTLTSNLHKVRSFFDVTAVKYPTSLDDIDM